MYKKALQACTGQGTACRVPRVQMENHSPKNAVTSLIVPGLLVVELESVPTKQAIVRLPTLVTEDPSVLVINEDSTPAPSRVEDAGSLKSTREASGKYGTPANAGR